MKQFQNRTIVADTDNDGSFDLGLEYPVRINKYLAARHNETRRAMDDAVARGRVFINGRRAVLGDKVEKTDVVEFRYTGKNSGTDLSAIKSQPRKRPSRRTPTIGRGFYSRRAIGGNSRAQRKSGNAPRRGR